MLTKLKIIYLLIIKKVCQKSQQIQIQTLNQINLYNTRINTFQYDLLKSEMYRVNNSSTVRKSSVSTNKVTGQSKAQSKKQSSDTLYLMQNENQILKIKNNQLSTKVDALNMQLRQRTHRVAQQEKNCQILRQSINNNFYTRDIQLQSQKKILLDKIVLGNSNINIYKDKIQDARRAVVSQQQKISLLIADKHHLEQQLRISKMQNQGSKTVLVNLEEQHEMLREKNNQLSLKKYSYEPQQKVISQQIEQRIRLIKNLNINQKTFKKQNVSRLIAFILDNIVKKRNKQIVLRIQRYGLKRAILRKKMILIGNIRKNYLNAIKAKTLSAFRDSFKPLPQEQKCLQILRDMKVRRQRAKLWRIWRNETAKAQYFLIRKYQCQNSIQKICQSVQKSLLISSFNVLKYHNNHHHTQIAISHLYSTLSTIYNRYMNSFVSSIKTCQQKYQIDEQIQKSAQQHSRMLVQSRIFYEWLALIKQKKKDSLSLKFKYFKRFKKIFVIRKRNVLSQMLGISKIKINDVNIKSICFAALKQQLYQNKQQSTLQEHHKIQTTLTQLKLDTQNRQKFDITLNKQLALNKINKYLMNKAKQALAIWRKEHQRIRHVYRIASILQFKLQEKVNFGFSRIQKARFQKLKLSIRDKIASCDYSYNYLVQQNTHIKQVLDKKQHELEKAKFVAILQRLIRKQKEIKHQYFYKFLRNGYQFWKVKKNLQRVDHLMSKKIKLVFFFLLKQNKRQVLYQQKIQYCINKHDQKQILGYMKTAFKILKQGRDRNKRMRRALTGIFDRNLQLNFYQAFGKMRNQSYQFEIKQIMEQQDKIQSVIAQTNDQIALTTNNIQTYTQRLRNKQQTFRQRKIMSLYKFFSKNVKKSVGSYISRWRNKIIQQKRIIKFVNLLDTKTESMIKMRFLLAVQKTKGDLQKKQLENRLQKYTAQFQNSTLDFDKFVSSSQQKMQRMNIQNQQNDKTTVEYQKKTQHMNNIKVISFLKHWGKNILKFTFREWKQQKQQFLQKWNRVFYLLSTNSIRNAFQKMSSEMRFQLVKDRIKLNLSRIYDKNYKHNTGLYFRIWRQVNIITKVAQHQQQLRVAMKGMEHIENHYQMVRAKYYDQVDYRINNQKLRRLTNAWRIYTEKKLKNNQKKTQLQRWLAIGYSIDAVNVLRRNKKISLNFKNRISAFQDKFLVRKVKAFLDYLYDVRMKKHTILNLFINKFCFYQQFKLKQSFFMRIKNYYRQKQINKIDDRTYRIQKVINCFQKKRKDILSNNMRIWNRNMYLMNIQRNLLKRLVNNAIKRRMKDLFYAWKLQKQARFMVKQHTQQGQVKKRTVQIKRLKRFLDDYKKQKGLLLQNQEGNFVVSPRFQQNKQKQLKRQNILKYKFVSRVILAMNGYQAPVRSWNNLTMYTKIRQKCLKSALMIKNRMEKGDLYTTFKMWHNGVKELRKMFNQMERKDLIRILNKQKDKMQIQYSKKVQVQQKVQYQLRRYKILSYQQKRKQRICSQILFKQARKVKSYAFDVWRKRVQQMKDQQAFDLQQRGNKKIMIMQSEVQQLQAHHREALEHNRMLKQAVREALQLAQMIKRISQQSDRLRKQLSENNISCQNLQEQNQELNNKLILAQKEAMNLLVLSNKGI